MNGWKIAGMCIHIVIGLCRSVYEGYDKQIMFLREREVDYCVRINKSSSLINSPKSQSRAIARVW